MRRGAFEFAFACDIGVASPGSRFGCPEVAVGLSISNGFSLLAPRSARRLVLTGELTGAEEALRLELVDLVVEDAEAEARRLSERIAGLARSPSQDRNVCWTKVPRNCSSTRSTASSISALASSRPRTPAKAWLRSWRNARPTSAGASARIIPAMVPEAELSETDAGLVPASPGWFVLNARDALVRQAGTRTQRAADRLRRVRGGDSSDAGGGDPRGEPRRADRDRITGKPSRRILVLSGEGLLIVEGQERPLRKWDFVHCPPRTRHAFVGAGDEPLVLLCASSRQFQKDGPWGHFLATRRPPATTRVRPRTRRTPTSPTPGFRRVGRRYPDGLLPD